MRLVTLSLFAASLLVCVIGGFSIVYALAVGYGLFFFYGVAAGHTPAAVFAMSRKGVSQVTGILLVLALIGMLTAAWRACGTIPTLLYHACGLLSPGAFLLLTFLLNCLLSALTGTSFGTAATMGVICMSFGSVLGLSPALLGGAVLSGAFFGDRCAPLSTSALLVAQVTETDLFQNLRLMVRTALLPFLLTSLLYLTLGLSAPGGGSCGDLLALFPRQFTLSCLTLLPAVPVILLSLLKCPVKYSMLASIGTAFLLALTVQHAPLASLCRWLILGYQSADPALASMLNGGGLVSMLTPILIVWIASSYSGIFDGTDLLTGLQGRIHALAKRTSPFAAALVTSLAAGAVSCNQTLPILLSNQLCRSCFSSRQELALALEDTAVVVSPLIPWSIAGAVPLATIGAPTLSLCFAFYLYLIPLFGLLPRRRRFFSAEEP